FSVQINRSPVKIEAAKGKGCLSLCFTCRLFCNHIVQSARISIGEHEPCRALYKFYVIYKTHVFREWSPMRIDHVKTISECLNLRTPCGDIGIKITPVLKPYRAAHVANQPVAHADNLLSVQNVSGDYLNV